MSEQPKATITALGHYLPDYVLTNAELEKNWSKPTTSGSKPALESVKRRILKDPAKATAYMGSQVAHEILKKQRNQRFLKSIV